jgi:hypothetical protein
MNRQEKNGTCSICGQFCHIVGKIESKGTQYCRACFNHEFRMTRV